jgi:hypothetical protein
MVLVVLATGEMLRLILKRPVGSQLLGPVILFLAGALLFEPYWALGVAFAIGLAGIVVLSIWGRKQAEASASAVVVPIPPALPTSHPTSAG